MLADLWKRPSLVVVLSAAVVISVFAARGDLRLAPVATLAQRTASAPDAPAARGPVVVRPERSGRVREEAPWSLQGRVFDTMGFLVVGAEIVAPGQESVRTDADGVFSVQTANAGTPLLVRSRGHRSTWVLPQPGLPDALLVQLEPAAPWDEEPTMPVRPASTLTGEGTVRGVDGKPLVGAFVSALGSNAWSRTDAIGRYSLPLPSSPTTLLVHHPDASGEGRGLVARSEPLQWDRTTGLVPLPELQTSLGSALRGTLRDGRGNPVVGVPVQVRGEGLLRNLESGISGMFRLAGLLPGRYEIRAFGGRGALGHRQEVVVDQAFVDCDVQLQPTEERRVQVLSEQGHPVAGAYVAMAFEGERRSVTQVDGDGQAAIRVATNEPEFEVRAADGAAAMSVRSYEVATGKLVVAAP